MKDVMNKNSDQIEDDSIEFSTKVLLEILDAIDSRSIISYTDEFKALNDLYKSTIKIFKSLPISNDEYDYLSQVLPNSLLEDPSYLEANYQDSIRIKLIGMLDNLSGQHDNATPTSSYTASMADANRIVEEYTNTADANIKDLPASLSDLQDRLSSKAVFKLTFDTDTETIRVNGIKIRQLNTSSSFSEILGSAIRNPGAVVGSNSSMSKLVSELRIPKELKKLFFPISGKSKFKLVPRISSETLKNNSLDPERLLEELLEMNKK